MNEIYVPRQQLMELLEKLNEFSEKGIEIFAVGGTSLTLLGLKDSTRDVDLNIDSGKGHKEIEGLFLRMGFEKTGENKWKSDIGFHIDLFQGGYIFCVQLNEDYKKLSKEIRNFGRIRLMTISPYDIIITKLARGDERDFDDIRIVFEKERVDPGKLAERYIQTMGNSFVRNARDSMLFLLKGKMKEWGMKTSGEALRMVEEWQM